MHGGLTRLRLIVGTVLAAALAIGPAAGCSGSPPEQTPATTAASTPSPTTDPAVALQAAVDATTLKPADIGTTAIKSDEKNVELIMPCDAPLDAQLAASHLWIYSGGYVSSHQVLAYDPEPGAQVLDQVRASLTRCDSWIWGGSWEMDFATEFATPAPTGADTVLTYCHQGTVITGTTKGNKGYLCDGYVSRGHLVATMRAVRLTQADAEKDVKKVLPLLAAALVKAAPTP